MSLVAAATRFVEQTPLPDAIVSFGIDQLCGRTRRRLALGGVDERQFAGDMQAHPIAQATDEANAQHYEIPAEFFRLVLGPRRKYSSCFYESAADTLAIAEENALSRTAEHADLSDGQSILELGCGWGSLTLWMAEHFPKSRITAVSNSASQRQSIEAQAAARGFNNVTIITADMNKFEPGGRFDRIVSVEMFEHMANWRLLLERVRHWLEPQGRLFLHVFSHRHAPYRFDHRDPADWIAQYFFTGGIMPSHGLIKQFPDIFTVEAEWNWSGTHYQRTALDWLANFDRHEAEIAAIMRAVYGADARVWQRRWRLFFLATAGLFGHRGGTEWGVSHYRLSPVVG
jgi:cyclopropane-fatty-acyl-phospholipid synthase